MKIFSLTEMVEIAKKLKDAGKSVVTLNGSFDLLHAGHLYMISEAKKQGDVLIVGLNTDASIKAYKSDERPIISLENRQKMMAALQDIDYVTSFDETDPCAFIKAIAPDVHVNGVEYGSECIEAETVSAIGARLHLVPRIPGLATSDIIAKIQSLSPCV